MAEVAGSSPATARSGGAERGRGVPLPPPPSGMVRGWRPALAGLAASPRLRGAEEPPQQGARPPGQGPGVAGRSGVGGRAAPGGGFGLLTAGCGCSATSTGSRRWLGRGRHGAASCEVSEAAVEEWWSGTTREARKRQSCPSSSPEGR